MLVWPQRGEKASLVALNCWFLLACQIQLSLGRPFLAYKTKEATTPVLERAAERHNCWWYGTEKSLWRKCGYSSISTPQPHSTFSAHTSHHTWPRRKHYWPNFYSGVVTIIIINYLILSLGRALEYYMCVLKLLKSNLTMESGKISYQKLGNHYVM